MPELTARGLLLAIAKFQLMHHWKPNWLIVPPELETAGKVICRYLSGWAPLGAGAVQYSIGWCVKESLASDEWFVTWSDDV